MVGALARARGGGVFNECRMRKMAEKKRSNHNLLDGMCSHVIPEDAPYNARFRVLLLPLTGGHGTSAWTIQA